MSRTVYSEKYLERRLTKEIKALGGLSRKYVSPGIRGVPDRLCFLPKGNLVLVELKTTGKKLSPLQKVEIKTLRQLGFNVKIIDTRAQITNLIKDLKNEL